MVDPDVSSHKVMDIARYCIRALLPLSVFTMVSPAIARADPADLASPTPPLTMARFYIVDSNGRSVSDEEFRTQIEPQRQHSSEPRRKGSNARKRERTSKVTKQTDKREPAFVKLNESKAWRCERHGFFFTADGRCIRPVIYVKQGTPPTIGRHPFRRNLTSK